MFTPNRSAICTLYWFPHPQRKHISEYCQIKGVGVGHLTPPQQISLSLLHDTRAACIERVFLNLTRVTISVEIKSDNPHRPVTTNITKSLTTASAMCDIRSPHESPHSPLSKGI